MAIQRITNPDKLVEEKINFFLDQLNHATSYAGWQWNLELESPVSLLEKIIFRLKNDQEFRLTYFDNHFKHSFFTSDTFWDGYTTYPDVKMVVTQYNSLTKTQKTDKKRLLSDVTFHHNLEILHRDLTHKMLRDLMEGVIKNSLCGHRLDELIPGSSDTHATGYKNLAYAIVAAYIFKGYSRTEIREIISRVFSKKLNSFPFPKHIKTKTQKQKHFAEATLHNQLHGFTNAYEEPKRTGKIIIKVFGGNFPEKFEFRYNMVTFYGKHHPSIEKVKQKMQEADRDAFFVKGDYILAAAEVSWHSQNSLLLNLVKKIRRELHYLSAVLERNFNVDTTSNFIVLSTIGRYQGRAWSSQRFDKVIDERKLENLNDNAYHSLRKFKGSAVDWFLKYESIFLEARITNSVANYWLYLEILFSYNQLKKNVITNVSTIVLANEKLFRDRRILITLEDCFHPFSGGFDLLNKPKLKGGLQKAVPPVRNGKITKAARKVNYPFIKELVKEYDTVLDKEYFEKAKEYYMGILTEAYEFRNFALHNGMENEASKDKLTATLPNIVIRLRWIIFEALKNGEHDTPFDLLIEKLIAKGKILLSR